MSAAQHYGWFVSPYSAKTRSYLRFIEADVQDIIPTAWVLNRRIRKAVGRLIMPTVELEDGSWLQDSSVIVDHFAARPGVTSIEPPGTTQRFASALLEVFADEWLPMMALHYRWNNDDNAQFAKREFAKAGFPWLPVFASRPLINPLAARMQSYLSVLGVDSETREGVEEMTRSIIGALDAQLTRSAFLLGDRPCLGDFALYGPLWAHLYRDPGSRHLFDDAPRVNAWMKRFTEGPSVEGEFLGDDEVPAALDPLFECILNDQWSWIRTLVEAIDSYCDAHPEATRVPRALGRAPFTIRGRRGERKLITFVQWKAQRARRAYERDCARHVDWMARIIGREPAQQCIPVIAHPMVLQDHKAVLASP